MKKIPAKLSFIKSSSDVITRRLHHLIQVIDHAT